MDTVHTEEYKGFTIRVRRDDDAQSPEEWGNEDLFLITTHNRYFDIHRDGFTMEGCRDNEYKNDYHVVNLNAYIHSGVALSLGRTGQFAGHWDSGQIGYVLIKKRQGFRNIRKAAESLVTEWNDYLSGNVYGYVTTNSDGDEIDSCWGFYGDYEDSVLPEAKSNIDAHIRIHRTTNSTDETA